MQVARNTFLHTCRCIIVLQCGFRRIKARRTLQQLRLEARSVEGMKAKTVGLEKKIIELQQTMDRKIQAAKEAQVRNNNHCSYSKVDLLHKIYDYVNVFLKHVLFYNNRLR